MKGTLPRLDSQLMKRLDAADVARALKLDRRTVGKRRRLNSGEMPGNQQALQLLRPGMATAAALAPTHRGEPSEALPINRWARAWDKSKPRSNRELDNWQPSPRRCCS
jgi:hypothetical protein